MVIFWVSVVVQAVCSGILASILADRKGHSEGAWFAAGLVLGVFGLIAAAGLPDMYARPGPYAPGPGPSRTCPDCAEPIRVEARVCKYCGHTFNDEDLAADALQALDSDDRDARISAIRVLCDVGGSNVVPHLIDVLGDCPPEVCSDVASKLKNLGATSAVPALKDGLFSAVDQSETKELERELVASFVDALSELADASIGQDIVGFLETDASLDSKVSVIRLLGSLRAKEQIPALLQVVSLNAPLRPHAIDAITAMGQDAVPILQRALGMAGRRQKKMIQSLLHELESSGPRSSREPNKPN